MATVKIRAGEVQITPGWRGEGQLQIELDMSKEEMKKATGEFSKHITDAEWCAWIKEFSPEYLKEEDA